MRFCMTGYDSDNESARSERLHATKFRLTQSPSPDPEVTRRSSSGSNSTQSSTLSAYSNGPQTAANEGENTQQKTKKIKTKHNPGDATFFRHFAPNNPELHQGHNYSRTFDLPPSDDEDQGKSDTQMDGPVRVSFPESVHDRTQFGGPSRGIETFGHKPALSLGHYHGNPEFMSTNSFGRSYKNPRGIGIDTRYESRSYDDYDRRRTLPKDNQTFPLTEKDLQDSAAVDGLLKLKGLPMRRTSTSSEGMATSPTLIPHLISASQAAPEQTLAAMAPESPHSTTPNPVLKQEFNLPGVNEIIGISNRQRTSSYSTAGSPPATSPQEGSRFLSQPSYGTAQGGIPLSRSSTIHSHDAGSPTRRSPETMPGSADAGQYRPRRVGPRQGPIPSLLSHGHHSSGSTRSYGNSATTSTSTSSGTEGLTPVSSYETPGDRSMSTESRPDSAGDSLSTKYVHYPTVPIGGYKCTFEGCDAPPFTTQYLLNSHANVHSSERPHFCSVRDCPRGEGGQGFKRKNEMIRHGLVHQSPGYLCPWCDREHRYPRPDNLQRHVSTHHKDKSRDDPQLLAVLAQRAPGGITRGRRRRQ